MSGLLDDFNRADENPLSGGGNWTSRNASGTASLQLTSNQVSGTSSLLSSMCWAVADYGPDCEATITVATLPASTSNYIRIYIRLSNAGVSTESGYMMQWSRDANGCRIFKETSREAFTQIAQAASATYTTGDILTFRAVGSAVTVYKNGVQVLTVTDSTYSAAGKLAIGCKDTVTRLDNFSGGAVSSTSIKTILGLAKASVKTVEGVALASVKTVEGLA